MSLLLDLISNEAIDTFNFDLATEQNWPTIRYYEHWFMVANMVKLRMVKENLSSTVKEIEDIVADQIRYLSAEHKQILQKNHGTMSDLKDLALKYCHGE